jgi:hypothetical protein
MKLSAQIKTDTKVSRALNADRESLLSQSATKRVTTEDLVAGRITLEEATARFLALDEGWPRIQYHVHTSFSGTSDWEKEARCIISLVCRKSLTPSERQSLLDRLKSEFTQLFPNASNVSFAARYE